MPAGHDSPVALKLWGKPHCHPDLVQTDTSVSNQADQQIRHLHQIKIDQRESMHKSGTCPPWKLRSRTLPAIKRLVPVYGWNPNSHPAVTETQPLRPDMSSSSRRALPAATWLGGVSLRGPNFSVVLCYVPLAWAQVHLKMRTNAEGRKAISEMKATGEGITTLKVTDSEQERRRHRPTGRTGWNRRRREQTSTTGRLSWITTELSCGSNSDRAASSGSAGSVSGLTCAQVNTWLPSSSWSEVGVVAVAWFQVQG